MFLLGSNDFWINDSHCHQPSQSLAISATLAHQSMPHFFSRLRIAPAHALSVCLELEGDMGQGNRNTLYSRSLSIFMPCFDRTGANEDNIRRSQLELVLRASADFKQCKTQDTQMVILDILCGDFNMTWGKLVNSQSL